jgi:UDP-glucuronate 4-epimerase
MKLLITGSAGFIGYHLAKKLLDCNYEICGIDNLNDYYSQKLKTDRLDLLRSYDNFKFINADICDMESLKKEFSIHDPEKVVNLAAQPGVRYSLVNPYAYMNSNLIGFLNILEMCKENNIKGLIYASSSSVYGDNKSKPFNIKDRVNKPISLYGATKRANELIAHSYSHLFQIKTTGLRFFTVYGPWYRPDMAMYIFADKINKGEDITVYNNGKMKRDFTYIDDIINGTISAIEKNYDCEIFNLGNNKSENLLDVIKFIEESLGKRAKINFQPIQPGDVLETYADIDYSKEKLNYSPTTNINVGIKLFVKWFREYHDA